MNTINGRTPEEIKKLLECCYGNKERRLCEKCPSAVKVEGYSELICTDFDASGESALAYIQQLESAQPKWISVEERLPEESGSYLVCTRRSDAFTAHFYLSANEWKSHFAGSAGKHITHWMPLPSTEGIE